MLLRVLIAVVIIGALVAGGIFIKNYYNETSAANDIEGQIQTSRNLATVVSEQTKGVEADLNSLAQQYSNAQQAVTAAQDQIPAPMNSNGIVKNVLLLARTSKVSAIPLKTQDWTKVQINTNTYSVFRMTIEVNGPESQIVDFVKQLQANLYQTLVIENLTFVKTITTPEATVTPAPTPIASVTADLSFAIYAR